MTIALASIATVGAYASPMPEPAAVTIETQAPVIKVVGQHVEITVPGDQQRQVIIYALTGQVVKSLKVNPGMNSIELPAGYYIVRCDRLSQRVVIR